MVDSGAAVSVCPLGGATEVPMSNHSRRARLRIAFGAQTEHAGQKMVELQKRGMTVVVGPYGSFVTRGQVMKPPNGNLDLEHSNGAHWMRLTRGENGTSTMALVDLGDAVPTSKDLRELPSVEDTIDVAREDAEANVPTAVTTPKRTWCR